VCGVVNGYGNVSKGMTRATEDPYYSVSWHLHPVKGHLLGHLHVKEVWDAGITGKGVMMGFSPQTLHFVHMELEGRYDPSSVITEGGSAEMVISKTASIATAVGNANNGVCSRGVAYGSKFVILGNGAKDTQDLKWMNDERIPCNLYVVERRGLDGETVHSPCRSCWETVEKANERGVIVVTSTGSGGPTDNCNYDLYANAPLTLAFSPHTPGGFPSSFAESCPNALVSVPVGESDNSTFGIFTAATPPSDCVKITDGHLAAPIGAGVVALMLEASNFSLSSCDIAHILVDTANQFPEVEWKTNGAGLKYHPRLGFGAVNAALAVRTAQGLEPRKKYREMETVTVSSGGEHNISEVGFVTMLFFAHAPSHALLEWVTVEADIKHTAASDLTISLTSPAGTTSVFATPRTKKASGFKLTVNRSPSENIATILANPANEAADMVKVEELSNVIFFSLLQECCTTKCEFSLQKRQPGKIYILLMDSMSYCFFDDQINYVNYVTRRKKCTGPHFPQPQLPPPLH